MKKLKRWSLISVAFIATLVNPLGSQAFDISWNGFGSVYYGQALTSDVLRFGFNSTHVNFTTFSLMGLNLSGSISDDFNFAGQLVALGNPVGTSDGFSVMAQWAYVSYSPRNGVLDGLMIKGGRQLYPALLASEYVRVSYLLPYRQVPIAIGRITPFSRFDGAAIYYTADVGIGKLTAGIFGGSPSIDTNAKILSAAGVSSNLSDLLGGQIYLDGNGWRVRGSFSRLSTQFSSNLRAFTTLTGHSQNYAVGYRFDKYNIVSWGEYSMVRSPDGSASNGGRIIGNGNAYYVLGGYRIGPFMPRYTFSQGTANFNIPLGTSAFGNGSITTHTFGLNFQAGSQAIVKAEFEHIVLANPPGPTGFFATGPATATATTGDALFLGLDFIF